MQATTYDTAVMTNTHRMAAIPKAFDRVCSTTTLSSSSISEHALSSLEKSTYASSTTMMPSNPPATMSRTTDAGTLLPVGFPGEHRKRSLEEGVAARRTFSKMWTKSIGDTTIARRVALPLLDGHFMDYPCR